jgi:hypothetical protein
MPLKIFENVSPFLKFNRPSSPVEDWPEPPLTKPTSELSASRMPQLAPTDSDESNVPSISPMLNEMACAWAQQPKATAAASACGVKMARIVVFVMRLPR